MKIMSMALLCLKLTLLPVAASAVEKFETLKDIFESTLISAQLSDFENYGKETSFTCFMATSERREYSVSSLQKRTHTQKVTTPNDGPLFPPEQTQIRREILIPSDIISYADGYSDDLAEELERVSGSIEMTMKPSYLQMKMNYIPQLSKHWSWVHDCKFPIEIDIRKNGNYLVMRITERASSRSSHIIGYQYCWKKN